MSPGSKEIKLQEVGGGGEGEGKETRGHVNCPGSPGDPELSLWTPALVFVLLCLQPVLEASDTESVRGPQAGQHSAHPPKQGPAKEGCPCSGRVDMGL